MLYYTRNLYTKTNSPNGQEGREQPGMADEYYSLSQAAEKLQVTTRTLKNWIYTGKIGAFKAGRGWRIAQSQIDDYVRTGATKAAVDNAQKLERRQEKIAERNIRFKSATAETETAEKWIHDDRDAFLFVSKAAGEALKAKQKPADTARALAAEIKEVIVRDIPKLDAPYNDLLAQAVDRINWEQLAYRFLHDGITPEQARAAGFPEQALALVEEAWERREKERKGGRPKEKAV